MSPTADQAEAPLAVSQVRFAGNPAGSPPPRPAARKLIRTVDLRLIVEDTEAASEAVSAKIGELGGYVADMSAYRNVDDLMHFSLRLRVPADRLDEAVEAIKAMALRIDSESRKTEDVTTQIVDFDARLRTLRSTESELRKLLEESRSRNQKAEDIMAIFRELTQIRTQIEQIQSQLETLQGQVSLSTLQLDLRPDAGSAAVVGEGWRPLVTARGSMRTLVQALRWLGDFFIFALIVLLPIFAILTAVGLLLRKLWRRLRRRK